MKRLKPLLLLFCVLMLTIPVSAATKQRVTIKLIDHNNNVVKTYYTTAGTTISLPVLSSKLGWKHTGWNVAKNKNTPNYTTSFVADQSRNLYESGRVLKTYTVKYKSADGSKVLSSRVCNANAVIRTPQLANTDSLQFLGWAEKTNQTTPTCVGCGTYTVKANVSLYAVYYKRTSSTDKTLTALDTSKYSAIIFVGDSRTVHMMNAVKAPDNVYFICKSGSKLDWLESTAYPQLLTLVKKSHTKPIAVVFNHGVNDLRRPNDQDIDEAAIAKSYSSFYNKMASTLRSYNCKLFFESVNPVNKAALISTNNPVIDPVEIEKFNIALRTAIAANYTYINTNSWLQHTGYVTLHPTQHIDDGLHYSNATSIRIYNYVMAYVNRSS